VLRFLSKREGGAELLLLYELVNIFSREIDCVLSFFIRENERVFRRKKGERRERVCVCV
jgi:hypothetical protein